MEYNVLYHSYDFLKTCTHALIINSPVKGLIITSIPSAKTILCTVMGMPWDFNQERMPILRKLMMEELINGSLVYVIIINTSKCNEIQQYQHLHLYCTYSLYLFYDMHTFQ